MLGREHPRHSPPRLRQRLEAPGKLGPLLGGMAQGDEPEGPASRTRDSIRDPEASAEAMARVLASMPDLSITDTGPEYGCEKSAPRL
jgi:hypothetical protein